MNSTYPQQAFTFSKCLLCFLLLIAGVNAQDVIFSAKSGKWSDANTWKTGEVPSKGARVLIRSEHRVIYDVVSEAPIRAIQVSGTLSFATDQDTRLDVGLLRIESSDEWLDKLPDCHNMPGKPVSAREMPTLEIGTPDKPVAKGKRALVRLVPFPDDDKDCLPGIVCVAGRMELHGSPLKRVWVKLAKRARSGDTRIFLTKSMPDWQPGDRIIITATDRQRPFTGNATEHVTQRPFTEERTIKAFRPYTMAARDEKKDLLLYLDKRLAYNHQADHGYAAEVANLSRNVVIESAEPDGVRGHTMYHRHSRGSISYVEFRNLGKKGKLGRYPIHFHLVGDTMRGSYVLGASITNSHNRWITLHGSQYLIVRDCVGYGSVGHGFFLENGSEVYNVLDRNLAVHALVGKPLPDQDLPYDLNDGAGFWWANSRNVFTRNVAVECDQHGFRFEVEKTKGFDPIVGVPKLDGTTQMLDLRTLPFLRFDDNEAHAQRRFALNLGGIRGMVYSINRTQPESVGGDVGGVGPDANHPFIIRNFKVWDSHWSFHAGSPSVLAHNMDLHDGQYGIWRSVMSRHEYRGLKLGHFDSSPIYFPMGAPDEERIGLKKDRPSFPRLTPIDDLSPASVITHIQHHDDHLFVQGETIDNGMVTKVIVNGKSATATRPNYAQWYVKIPVAREVKAESTDQAGNQEIKPHVRAVDKAGF